MSKDDMIDNLNLEKNALQEEKQKLEDENTHQAKCQ